MNERCMGVAEAALRLGVSKAKVRNLIANGELSYVRIGGRLVINATDLDHFIEAHRVPAIGELPRSKNLVTFRR